MKCGLSSRLDEGWNKPKPYIFSLQGINMHTYNSNSPIRYLCMNCGVGYCCLTDPSHLFCRCLSPKL